MAHLLPAVGATAGTSLATGITTGAAMGQGGLGLLQAIGASPLGGMSAMLPTVTPGLTGALPAAVSPGIFSAATPALAGLPSVTPGIFSQAAPALGGLKSFAPLAQQGSTFAQVAPNLVGQNQILAEFSRQGLGQGFKQVGSQLAGPADTISKAAGVTPPTSVPSLQAMNQNIINTITKQAGIGPTTPVGLQSTLQTAAPSAEYLAQANAARDMATASKVAEKFAAEQAAARTIQPGENFLSNLGNLIKNPSMEAAGDYVKEHPYATAGAAYGLYNLMKPKYKEPPKDKSLIRPYEFERTQRPEAYAVSPISDTSERTYFTDTFTPLEPYEAPGPEYKRASGGITSLAVGGPVEQMAAMNAVGANTGYPMSGINTPMYSNPMIQRPEAVNVISPSGDAGVTAYSGEPKFASGGISDLGSYSDGGRLLRGPGDGVSDSIPAVIGQRQPARLADGEFVVPARIVSELGNGSTEAGARKLYAMMDRVQKARRKTVGKDRVAANTRADKHLPA